MKINEVTEARAPGYADDINPQTRKLANMGRTLMDISSTTSMKGLSDEEIGKTNKMSSFGDALTRFGTAFGPKNLPELLKTAGVTAEEAKEFLAMAQVKGPVKQAAPEPEDDEDDEFAAPDDDEIARQADARAAKRK